MAKSLINNGNTIVSGLVPQDHLLIKQVVNLLKCLL